MTIHKNLHKLKKLNLEPLLKDEIKMGIVVLGPSGRGGVCRLKCSKVDRLGAFFEPVDTETPKWLSLEVTFDTEAIPTSSLKELSLVLSRNPICWSLEDRELISQAEKKGYVTVASYTQVAWTCLGEREVKRLVRVKESK